MRRHLNPSTAVALLALFVALGGTGYAAVKINGKNIRAGTIRGSALKGKTLSGSKVKSSTLTGNKFKTNTLTGRQIKESTLGSVPRADAATAAVTANVVPSAAPGFVPRGRVLDTDLIKLAATGTSADTSPLKTVFTSGPFKFQVACWDAGGGKTAMRFLITSTEPGSILNNQLLPLDQTNTPVVSEDPDDAGAAMAAPSGATLFADVYTGIKALGADCLIAVDGVATP